jgi:hypothetical protein
MERSLTLYCHFDVRALSIAVASAFFLGAIPVFAAEPVVAVWYRGTPPGTPRLDDLAAIKAAGFNSIVWPLRDPTTVATVSRMAGTVGLAVVIQPDAGGAFPRAGWLNVDVTRVRPAAIPAIVWRAVAGGVRTVSFDPGSVQGAGLDGPDGTRREWAAPAIAIARQLSANARLIGELGVGPSPQFISLRPVPLDVQLLETSRAWVLIATNTGQSRAEAEVALPPGVPYAIWVSLVDASTIAMLDRPTGARWRFEIDAGAAAVYVIDKTLK